LKIHVVLMFVSRLTERKTHGRTVMKQTLHGRLTREVILPTQTKAVWQS
jgi:hypothetical protein